MPRYGDMHIVLIRGRGSRVRRHQATLVPATPGCEICVLRKSHRNRALGALVWLDGEISVLDSRQGGHRRDSKMGVTVREAGKCSG